MADPTNHDTWLEFFRRDHKFWEKSFKFCFSREPVDRFLSSYMYLKAGGRAEIDRHWRDKYLSEHQSVNDFILSGGLENCIKKGVEHFIPQYLFICDRDLNLMVDHVARFENIESEVDFISSKIGVVRDLPKLNSSGMRSLDVSEEALKKLKMIYKNDYEILKYKEI